jgi:uncharacterized membrane protein required for colicin V production
VTVFDGIIIAILVVFFIAQARAGFFGASWRYLKRIWPWA